MNSKIIALKDILKAHNLGGYIITSKDEFQSEYPAPYSKRLEYLTEFSCSNGILVVLENHNLFFTDPRYLTAAKNSLSNTEIFDLRELKDFNWQKYSPANSIVGFDPHLFTKNDIKLFEKLSLYEILENLVDKIWLNKPAKPTTQAFKYEIAYSGQEAAEKIQLLRDIVKQKNYASLLITAPESVCWLLNIRASDSDYSPIMLSYCYIDETRIILFTNERKFKKGALSNNIECLNINNLSNFLKNLDKKICINKNVNLALENSIQKDQIIIDVDPILLLRATKNDVEIQGAQAAHITDAIALIEFFTWFAENGIGMNEYQIGLKITDYRKAQQNYFMDSFAPICGFGANGAIIHYKAAKSSSTIISSTGLLLIDSGGHYLGGTTDVTRTIAIAEPTQEEKEYYTRVLKGHIALAKIKFPKGCTGSHLDILARQYLWDNCEDYAHGTGHGVGNFLSVHEGPMMISLHDKNQILVPNMILSNEPGYYKEGSFGIRIENLQFIKACSKNNNFLEFEQLTLVPYCHELILFEMLTKDEIAYLNGYYKKIETKIMPFLSEKAKKYLKEQLGSLFEQTQFVQC